MNVDVEGSPLSSVVFASKELAIVVYLGLNNSDTLKDNVPMHIKL